MLWIALAMALLGSDGPDPIAAAQARFAALDAYEVTVISASGNQRPEKIRYFYKKPGLVRMEFISPHPGAVLIYSPQTRRVLVWPFGAGAFPSLDLSPENPLIRSAHGRRVDRCDVGTLLERVHRLQAGGSTQLMGEESVGRWMTLHLIVTGTAGHSRSGVHHFHLWLERDTLFPVKVESRDGHDQVIESVLMDDVTLNPILPDNFFTPEHAAPPAGQ